MAQVTVFGAGAMGTAMAMHAARLGADVALWANPVDEPALRAIRSDGKHPALPEHLPERLSVFGPDDLGAAADGCEVAIMAASSAGARSLAKMVEGSVSGLRLVVSVAKGLESDSGKRTSQVYAEEFAGVPVAAIGGPCLAAELAQGLPTAAVWGGPTVDDARIGGSIAEGPTYQVVYTDDLPGLEFCSVAKNVTAIGMGLLDGLGQTLSEDFKNAKAALFTKGITEVAEFIQALGGRWETAMGLAGLGDILVTGLGGRNRLYGELVGAGGDPMTALHDMQERGMTVEGVDSARDVHRLATEHAMELPFHTAIFRVLLEGGDPRTLLEVLC
ncbi:MAG: NAD(P)H-dependent glycerol-3-phosphate dehydrogenase [Actinomycetota bacterium]